MKQHDNSRASRAIYSSSKRQFAAIERLQVASVCLRLIQSAITLKYDFDLFVIGAGSGGVRAARMSASLGAKVGIAEERYLGGTCVNVGCIPKKLFVYGSHFSEEFDDAGYYGWDVSSKGFEWSRLLASKNKEIERLNGIYRNLLENPGVEIFESHAKLIDQHRIQVGEQQLSSESILIATGSWPYIPHFPGHELVSTSNDAFFFDSLPERVIVVGGGYIAVEFAGIYQGLGVDTTLIYRGPLFLRGFDDQIRQFLCDEMTSKGVKLRFNTTIDRVTAVGSTKVAHLQDGESLEADEILYATGRRANIEGLQLDNVGVEVHQSGGIQVDEFYRTQVPNVHAIGDVINRVQLTPIAIAEGMCVAYNLYGGERRILSYNDIPTAIFSQPSIGTVGPTEAEARKSYADLHVYDSSFRALKHTLTENRERTLMKLLVDGGTDRVIAAHMVGPDAGEIVQGLAVAIKSGATKADFDLTIGIHPTAAEEFVTMRERSR